jgi:Photosynthetic reaction centre cytochrome C subunit
VSRKNGDRELDRGLAINDPVAESPCRQPPAKEGPGAPPLPCYFGSSKRRTNMTTSSVLATLTMAATLGASTIGYANDDPGSNTSIEDSLETERAKFMNEVMAAIKGKEKLPADSVFKNLKVIKGQSSVSAEHFLWMMNWGWGKELGVSCSHCHEIGKWESDSLPAKDIARGMWTMRVKINKEILPSITGRDYEKTPKVTCLTCHRGKPVPDAS